MSLSMTTMTMTQTQALLQQALQPHSDPILQTLVPQPTSFQSILKMRPNKALQPTPIRFAPGVARTIYLQLITSILSSPVQGG